MCDKMCLPIRIISFIAFLVWNLQAVPSTAKEIGAHNCFSCEPQSNTTNCSVAMKMKTEYCPQDKPLCASTVIVADGISTKHSCAPATGSDCTFIQILESHLYQLTCVCHTDLCNVMPSEELIQDLRKFAINFYDNKTTDVIDMFFNITKHNMTSLSRSFTAIELTDGIIEEITTLDPITTTTINPDNPEEHMPTAMGLKQEAPSDDDEDESEGSGAYEETKNKRPASAPAAPSSYLPAGENSASPIISLNFLLIVPFLRQLV